MALISQVDQQVGSTPKAPTTTTTAPPTTPTSSSITEPSTPADKTYTYGDIAADYTDDTQTRFNGLPGMPEVWYEEGTGKVYMVYFPPGVEPKVPLLYHVPNEDILKSYFGDKPMGYDKRFTSAQLIKMGAVTWGTVSAIADTTGDPWAGFVERMDRAAEVMPWLADPDIFQVVAVAYLEGRDPQDWEFEASDWWQTHTEAERDWIKKLATDPKTAEQELGDRTTDIVEMYRSFGIWEPPTKVVSYIRDKWASGQWTNSMATEQVRLTLGLASSQTIDKGLQTITGPQGAGEVVNYQTTIRDLYDTWLGPAYAPDEAAIQRWSNQFALAPEVAREALTDQLRQQRLSLFPEYTNPNSTYQDIAQPWRSYVSGIWGVVPDDTDAEFQSMLRFNDASAIAKKAREVGLQRDYDAVKSRALDDLRRQMSGGVRGVT